MDEIKLTDEESKVITPDMALAIDQAIIEKTGDKQSLSSEQIAEMQKEQDAVKEAFMVMEEEAQRLGEDKIAQVMLKAKKNLERGKQLTKFQFFLLLRQRDKQMREAVEDQAPVQMEMNFEDDPAEKLIAPRNRTQEGK